MRLSDLNAQFLDGPEPDQAGQRGMCVELDCPCGQCGRRLTVPFQVALDGHPTGYGEKGGWTREGDTLETLTLSPSIDRPKAWGYCGWHGFIERGEVRQA